MQLQNPPATLDRVIFAVVGRKVDKTNRFADLVDPRHHAVEELGPVAAAFGSVIRFDLDFRDRLPLLLGEAVPPNLHRVHNEIAGFCRAAEYNVQLPRIFVEDAARRMFAGDCHIVVACAMVASRRTAPGKVSQLDRRLAVDAQSFNAKLLAGKVFLFEIGKNLVRLPDFFFAAWF